ncbi:MAG: hypothetical protein MI892_28460 [Desulfobacterales bacterium]|nr:hypothetical protein [Desulfobacterales bacterium]
MGWVKTGAVIFLIIVFMGCGRNLPFEYRYLSPSSVEITYQGQKYLLNQYGDSASTPFDYSFESDGDLDIRIEGKDYEIDSPYDVDKKKKKKKKTTKKKSKRK